MGMKFKASGGGKAFTPVEAGSHPARCYGVVDLGDQKGSYKGEEKVSRKVRLLWEIPTERRDDGLPMTIGSTYTSSLSERALLRKDLEAWRGKPFTETELAGFDSGVLIGKTCMLSVVHAEREGKTYAQVNGIVPIPKGLTVMPAEMPTVIFDLEDFDEDVYESLPKFLKETIAKSPQYQELMLSAKGGHSAPSNQSSGAMDDMDDDIPF